ncbi:hypothetical protein TNIN_309971 [Trichonephila inaurata madagascariensis]|uniref:Uncharacterized protein n=1 Tax=Trichonephila inaurata madagascariensis TaxID=2747483 RepID=A0A8X6IDL6_9ARAC|nr:hypothetical protein TNIN_309971 [Trichonephila inaurata madagascariensis]
MLLLLFQRTPKSGSQYTRYIQRLWFGGGRLPEEDGTRGRKKERRGREKLCCTSRGFSCNRRACKLKFGKSHSQELLDSSSASSISVFADPNDGQSSSLRTHDPFHDSHKQEYSPRASMDEALKSEAAFIQYLSSIL